MNRILLLGASFGTGNMGVGALAAGALTVVSQRHPGAEVALLDYGREPTVSAVRVGGRTLAVPLVNLRFSWKLLLPNNVAALLALSLLARGLGAGLRRWLIRRNAWLRAIAGADAAVAVSGGDSFSDLYGMGRFLYVALPQLLALSLGVKLIMLPQSIGPFRRAPARWIAGFVVRRAQRVYSRDEAGIEEIRKLAGARGKAAHDCFCYDMGFVVEPHPPRELDLGGLDVRRAHGSPPLVGLNVSGLLLMGGYSRANMFGLRLDYGALVDRLVALFIDEKNAEVLLVPHVFGDTGESDAAAAAALHERLRNRHPQRLHAVRGRYDQNEIKHVIGLCDFFVGSRMHACIAALSQCIPAVGVAYSDKFAGVFDSVGAGHMVADPRRLGLEETVGAVSRAFDGRGAERARLRAAMPGIRARVLGLLDAAA
jgi:polysaccharide pyruvyl transferase WcaK-like protein